MHRASSLSIGRLVSQPCFYSSRESLRWRSPLVPARAQTWARRCSQPAAASASWRAANAFFQEGNTFPDVARALDIPSGKPLLKLVRFSYDANGRLQDHLVARYNSDLFSYRVETKVGLD